MAAFPAAVRCGPAYRPLCLSTAVFIDRCVYRPPRLLAAALPTAAFIDCCVY